MAGTSPTMTLLSTVALAHSRTSGNPVCKKDWVPAFAGTSGIDLTESDVMAGRKARSAVFAPEVPAIPIRGAWPCNPKRDARHRAGHDK